MLRYLAIAGLAVLALPAHAQLDDLPRFEALDRQLQEEEQRRFDEVESARQRDRMFPAPGVSEADRALRDLDYRRKQDQMLREAEMERQRVQRERDLAAAALPNTRVPAASLNVVTHPEAYILPPAPPGTYYARVGGRFVTVDAASEIVRDVLPVQPTDPVADAPMGPRPLPQINSGLPVRRISPTSALVIRDFAGLRLPAPPHGQYYARVDVRIVLVDARTELPVGFATPG
jgi:Ni/Co efflux regulator RcnB